MLHHMRPAPLKRSGGEDPAIAGRSPGNSPGQERRGTRHLATHSPWTGSTTKNWGWARLSSFRREFASGSRCRAAGYPAYAGWLRRLGDKVRRADPLGRRREGPGPVPGVRRGPIDCAVGPVGRTGVPWWEGPGRGERDSLATAETRERRFAAIDPFLPYIKRLERDGRSPRRHLGGRCW